MGGAVGAAVAEWLKVTPCERQTLIAAGAGAGLAAAFNAPLAGLAFVLEEVQRDFSPMIFSAAFIASVTADMVTQFLTDQLPVFHVATYPIPSLVALPAFLILGLLPERGSYRTILIDTPGQPHYTHVAMTTAFTRRCSLARGDTPHCQSISVLATGEACGRGR
jgi:hypothetical protein